MIKEFIIGQEEEIYLLVKNVFDEFVGYDYSPEGNSVFNEYIEPGKIVDRYKKGNMIFTYQDCGKIIGIIELRDNNHICLFFVDKQYHSMGVGKLLLSEALKKVASKTDFLEVNASPFSERIYAKLGFYKTNQQQEINGIKFIPMKMEMVN